ncbi:hypothetical protein NKH18_48160 [Streptomyces sp. M10(2022)]
MMRRQGLVTVNDDASVCALHAVSSAKMSRSCWWSVGRLAAR